MPLGELVKLVRPPAKPIDGISREVRLRTATGSELDLPEDYKQFSAIYGSGAFKVNQIPLLCIQNPFAPDFSKWASSQLDALRDSKDSSGEEGVPYAIFPDEAGLFPLGRDDQATRLWWRTVGEANSWPIIVQWFLGPDSFRELRMPLTELLVRLFRGEIDLPPWPEPWSRYEVVFVPFARNAKGGEG